MSDDLTARNVLARAAGRAIARGYVWRPDVIAREQAVCRP